MSSKIRVIFLFVFSFIFIHCGGSGGTKFAGLDLEMPDALDELNTDYLRVSGSVWTIDSDGNPIKEISPEKDALLTIRGQYALPVKNVEKGDEYEYRLQIYYQADAYTAPAISAVEISTDIVSCPELSLSPDTSLSTDEEGSQWLLLCTSTFTGTYDSKVAIDVAEADIVCDEVDADGDGSSNLTELSLTYDPYNGDYDGDCVADGSDAFPNDPSEWLDTDSDGLGDNSDSDKDADGLDNDNEESIGTDPLDSDSDDDTVVDGSDNCPLDGSSSDQTDSDSDGEGDLCDDDADNDGLSDSTEAELGTDPADSDTDDDTVNDGTEVNQGSNPLDSNTDDDQDNDGDDAFPIDATEWDDTDSDGVGDNADLCDNTSDPENTDTDSDGTGNACDDDDDNDGVSDDLEDSLGSDSLDTDSDDDGLEDWFGETMETGQDPCLLDSDTSSTTDQDGDGFTTTCDLSDDPATDPSADEVNYLAVFVDATNGNDENDGSITSPVQTLDKAGNLAESENKNVYATGDYELTATLDLPDGVFFYGGFADDFLSRSPIASPSSVSSSLLNILVEVENASEGAGIDGLALTNGETGNSSIGLSIIDSTFSLKNSVITLGNANHIQGIHAEGSAITIDNNVLAISDLGDSIDPNVAYGIFVSDSTGILSDNEITIADYQVQREAVYCSELGDSDITLSDNSLDVLETAAGDVEQAGFDYVVGCYGEAYSSTATSIPDGTFEGFEISGMVVDALF